MQAVEQVVLDPSKTTAKIMWASSNICILFAVQRSPLSLRSEYLTPFLRMQFQVPCMHGSHGDWCKDSMQDLFGVFPNITFHSCHNILIFYLLVFLHSQLQYARCATGEEGANYGRQENSGPFQYFLEL
jgi:hypothetical protein